MLSKVWDDSRVISAEKAFDKAVRRMSTAAQIEVREAFEKAVWAAEAAAVDRALATAGKAIAAL